MRILKKIFIKDYKNTSNPEVRLKYGLVAGVFGIITNVILCGLKVAIGLIGNSITVLADAINNLSDAGSSVVTVFGFKLSARPADKEHPYGHARYEYITGLIVAFLVFAIGVILCKSSIEKIIKPEDVTVNVFTYIVLAVAILGKLVQMATYIDFGKAISSNALKASGVDSRNDIISTLAVLIATIIIDTTGTNVDGYFGLAVSLFILISSIKLIKETINPLLGEVPDKELVSRIRDKIMSYDGVLGLHDLMVHNYGATSCFVIAHVEVAADVDIMVSHDLMDNIERDFREELNIHLSIHMDPIERNNPEVKNLKDKVVAALQEYNPNLSIHDFRRVCGVTHTNLLFDAVVPYGEDVTKDQIETVAKKAVEGDGNKYFFVIEIDRSYN